MLTSWRFWALALLLLGPYAAFIGLGYLWLLERGWLVTTAVSLVWIGSGAALYALGARWTKTGREILPPIDWNAPSTFAPVDREAWSLVLGESEGSEGVPMESLTGADLYIETGRRLAARLAKHYHPLADDPIEKVPVIELLSALELAAEDLGGLVRQVPGGDLITTGHWKSAVQAAGYIQKANSIYSYLMPLFNPITGLPRLASQHMMIKPAWKNMQQNLLRWFYQAYVNRLGMHLIELYSGRLVIGTDRYRRLTRKIDPAAMASAEAEGTGPLTIAVAGARESGHERLGDAARSAAGEDGSVLRARLAGAGLGEGAAGRLLGANWVEVPGYTAKPDRETARDRSTRKEAVEEAAEADLVVLLIDDRCGTLAADAAFAGDWDRWYAARPRLERPPLVVALISGDPARVVAARAVLPPTATEVIAVDPAATEPAALLASVLPAVASQLPRAERVALIRHLQRLSNRSKAGRLVRQVGQQGRHIWDNFRRPKPDGSRPEAMKSP